jgi:hypothetical protein
MMLCGEETWYGIHMVENEIAAPKIVSRDQWLAERKELLGMKRISPSTTIT